MLIRLLLAILVTVAATAAAAAECRVVDPELQGFYEGGCRKGLAHGKGVAHGEATYAGEFRNGLKHGSGIKTWAWGDRYEGGFVADRKQGAGMYVWGADSPWAGERFVGQYLADRREGWGTYFWPNGDRFEGQWKADGRYGYSAMEQRRQAAQAARSEALTPGTRVCQQDRTDRAGAVTRVGTVEALAENNVQVRLLAVEGTAAPGPGAVLSGSPGDWTPCL